MSSVRMLYFASVIFGLAALGLLIYLGFQLQ
jgi:hypothetical protein